MKKNILIDSTFFDRNDKTDLLLKFDKPIKNVTKISLKDINYPKNNYNVSAHFNNNKLILRKYNTKHQIINVSLTKNNLNIKINQSKNLINKFRNKLDNSGIVFEYVYKIFNTDLLENKSNCFKLTNSKSTDLVYSQTFNSSLIDK